MIKLDTSMFHPQWLCSLQQRLRSEKWATFVISKQEKGLSSDCITTPQNVLKSDDDTIDIQELA